MKKEVANHKMEIYRNILKLFLNMSMFISELFLVS